MLNRLGQIAEAPFEPRFSSALSNQGSLRKSRVGGWRIIFTVDEANKFVNVVTIDVADRSTSASEAPLLTPDSRSDITEGGYE